MGQKAVKCVSGIIISKGKLLVERRRADDAADPGFIAIPGGHVEAGESIENAIVREMKEELGIVVKRARFVGEESWIASDAERQSIYYFVIEEWEGKLSAHESSRIYWESEIGKLARPDKKIMQQVLAKYRSQD